MKINVEYFAALAQATGCRNEVVTLEEESTVDDLINDLITRHPHLVPFKETITAACDDRWMQRNTTLHDDAHLQLMPPVSGG